MLLSLVVFFTQSIQLSKIRRRDHRKEQVFACRAPSLGWLVHLCPRFNLQKTLKIQSQAAIMLLLVERQSSNGGAARDRTVDPLLAKQMLSQLSYSPIPHQRCGRYGGPG